MRQLLLFVVASGPLSLTTALLRAEEQNPVAARAAAPTIAPGNEMVRVDFRSTDRSPATLHVWSFTADSLDQSAHRFGLHHPICSAPCAAYVPRGTYRFGVSGEERVIEPVEGAFRVDGPTTLVGEYDDDGTMRAVGWIIIGVASLVATVGFADASRSEQSAGAGVGLLSLAVGVPLGLVFALNMDDAELTSSTAGPTHP